MKEILKRFSVNLLLGANLCTILLLWLCVALTFVSPDHLPHLSLITLLFPVFLLADALFLILWLLFHARLAWVPIAGALAIGGYIIDYCPLHFGNNTEGDDTAITIVSYNVGGMKDDDQRAELLNFLTATNADIVCLQELGKNYFTTHKEWLDSAAYHIQQKGSLCILSHLPFHGDTIQIDYPTRSNHSTAIWIDCHGDSLLIVNNHLESNGLSTEEKDEYTNAIIDPDRQAIKNSSKILMGKLSEATAYRGAQADSVCSLIQRHEGHDIIVCGDLNETPISYTYQRINRHLTSAYRETGKGPGFTYSRRSFPVRIDHLFHSDGWTCTAFRIDRTVLASDHYPLIVRLSKKVR